MKQMNRLRRFGVSLFAAALSLSAVQVMTAHAEILREVRAVNLNISGDLGILNPEKPRTPDAPWGGDRLFFGTHNQASIPFRVLDKKTTDFGGTTMFLDCDIVLYNKAFTTDSASPANAWKKSTLRNELNTTFLDSFTTLEKAAIHKSMNPASHAAWPAGWDGLNYGELSPQGDKFFLLDAREAAHLDYGYSNVSDSATNRTKHSDNDNGFWLRSPDRLSSTLAGYSDSRGDIYNFGTDRPIGVSPAFNLKLDSVLFTTLLGTDKSAFSETADPAILQNTWVPTLVSSESGFRARRTNPLDVITYAAGGNISLSLSGAMQTANQISAMLLNEHKTVLYYGKIAEASDRQATVSMPSGLIDGATYTLLVFSEEAHADRTSYAGNTEQIKFTVGRASTPPENVRTVRFHLNGHGTNAPDDVMVSSGETITAPAAPSDVAYDFGGWYREAACVNPWNFDTDRVTEDVTLYAKWAPKSSLPEGRYRIRFDANGGTVSPAEMVTDADGKLSSLPVPVRDRYAFLGWFTVSSGGREVNTQTIFDTNKTVYAHWSRISGGRSGGGSSYNGASRPRFSNGGRWTLDASGYRYHYATGAYAKNEWKKLPYGNHSEWYAFNEAGYMRTGWFSENGRWYYLSEEPGSPLGKMLTGWTNINGIWYYLEPFGNAAHPQGAMYSDEKTPDGYLVNKNGAWIK